MSVVSTPSMKVMEWAVLFEKTDGSLPTSQKLPDFCERSAFQEICFTISCFVHYLLGDKTYRVKSQLNGFIRVANSINKEDIRNYVNSSGKRKIGFPFSAVEKLIDNLKEYGRESGGQPIISKLHVLEKKIKKVCIEVESEELSSKIKGLKIEGDKVFYQMLDGIYVEEGELFKEYNMVSDVHKELLPIIKKWLVDECTGWKETSPDPFLKYCNEKWIFAERLFLAHVGKEDKLQLKIFLDAVVKKKGFEILSQEISEKKGFLRFDQLTKRFEELCKESVSSEELEKKIVVVERLLEEMDGLYFFYIDNISLLQKGDFLSQETCERIRKDVTEKYTQQIDILRLNKQLFAEVAFSRRHFKQLLNTVQILTNDLYSVDQIDEKRLAYLWNYFNQIEKEIQKIALLIPQSVEWKESTVLLEQIQMNCCLAKEYINLRIGEGQVARRIVIDGLTVETGGTCAVHSEIESITVKYVKVAEEECQTYQKKNKKTIESILGKTCLGFIGGGLYGYAQAGIPGMCTEAIIAATAVLAGSVAADVGERVGLPKWGSEVLEMVVFASTMYGMHQHIPLYLEKKDVAQVDHPKVEIDPNNLKNRKFSDAEVLRFDSETSRSKMSASVKEKTDSLGCLGIKPSDSESHRFGDRFVESETVVQQDMLNSIHETPPLCSIDQAPVLNSEQVDQKISIPAIPKEQGFWEGFGKFLNEYMGSPMYGVPSQPSGSSYNFIDQGVGMGESPLGYFHTSAPEAASNIVFVDNHVSFPAMGDVVYVYSSVGGVVGGGIHC